MQDEKLGARIQWFNEGRGSERFIVVFGDEEGNVA
jgi:hypothetical protein